jgi:hypothetical protein
MYSIYRRALISVSMALVCLGCGPDYGGRVAVNGTVKLKGEPIDDGVIEFVPLAADGETKSGAQILKGAYTIPAEKGLVPGEYRVIITAGDGRTRPDADPNEPPGPTGANIVSKDRVPADYNVASKQVVKVTADGPNEFNYDIP